MTVVTNTLFLICIYISSPIAFLTLVAGFGFMSILLENVCFSCQKVLIYQPITLGDKIQMSVLLNSLLTDTLSHFSCNYSLLCWAPSNRICLHMISSHMMKNIRFLSAVLSRLSWKELCVSLYHPHSASSKVMGKPLRST